VIEIKGLVKRYGSKTVVNGLTMSVREGEIFGFLGPNGAGKTTTLRVLTTLTDFSEGTVSVGGHDVAREPKEAKAIIGLIQQQISLDKDLTVRENMMQHAIMHGIPAAERRERIERLSKFIGLGEYMGSMINSLSGGWKKRVAIVCALVHEPKILFLDEPTVGLDIQTRRLIWDLIRKLNRGGTTVFLTSHYIEEVEALCETVGIIDKGNLIAFGTPRELRERVGSSTVEYPGEDHKTVYRHFSSREEANRFASETRGAAVTIRDTSLEDCFVALTGKTVEGGA
jgi:ABC-2 type transport system ATP-binding protein